MQRLRSVRALVAVLWLIAVALAGPVTAGERPETAPVMVSLATAAQPEPIPFRDRTLLTERIATGNHSFARLLLGGRVMVLARQRASLRITEVPGATTVEVERGRVALTVDRENLHPEDLVEVRTPHAVVTVPGDTLIVEVAGAGSTFRVFGARVVVFALDPATGAAVGPPTSVAGEKVVTVGPSAPATDVAQR